MASLHGPASLLRARQDHAEGCLSAAARREQKDAAILAAQARQREIGLGFLSDGEFRRGSWITDVARPSRAWCPGAGG